MRGAWTRNGARRGLDSKICVFMLAEMDISDTNTSVDTNKIPEPGTNMETPSFDSRGSSCSSLATLIPQTVIEMSDEPSDRKAASRDDNQRESQLSSSQEGNSCASPVEIHHIQIRGQPEETKRRRVSERSASTTPTPLTKARRTQSGQFLLNPVCFTLFICDNHSHIHRSEYSDRNEVGTELLPTLS